MSTRHKPEFPPLLPAGLHELDQKSLKALVVDGFPRSTSREGLWKNFLLIVGRLKSLKMPCKIWIDGSFVTKKLDPDDIDFVVDFLVHLMTTPSLDQKTLVKQLSKQHFRYNEKLHTFVMFTAPIMHVEYAIHDEHHERWKKDFGFSYATKEPKGIAVLEVLP